MLAGEGRAALPASGWLDHSQLRRKRARSDHKLASGKHDGRPHLGGQRAQRGKHFPFHGSAAGWNGMPQRFRTEKPRGLSSTRELTTRRDLSRQCPARHLCMAAAANACYITFALQLVKHAELQVRLRDFENKCPGCLDQRHPSSPVSVDRPDGLYIDLKVRTVPTDERAVTQAT